MCHMNSRIIKYIRLSIPWKLLTCFISRLVPYLLISFLPTCSLDWRRHVVTILTAIIDRTVVRISFPRLFPFLTFIPSCEISSSHGGEYEVHICLLGRTAV
jgi:hypothetical protein